MQYVTSKLRDDSVGYHIKHYDVTFKHLTYFESLHLELERRHICVRFLHILQLPLYRCLLWTPLASKCIVAYYGHRGQCSYETEGIRILSCHVVLNNLPSGLSCMIQGMIMHYTTMASGHTGFNKVPSPLSCMTQCPTMQTIETWITKNPKSSDYLRKITNILQALSGYCKPSKIQVYWI